MQSEVARIREQIEVECESLHRALYDFATMASHDIINQKYDSLGQQQEQLGQIIGEQASREVLCDVYMRVV